MTSFSIFEVDANSHRTVLTLSEANRLGSGRAGTVYRHPDHGDRVVKCYRDPKDARAVSDKLKAMLQCPVPSGSSGQDGAAFGFAWPVSLIYDRYGMCGFCMSFFSKDDWIELANILQPTQIAHHNFSRSYHLRLRIALNLARAVAHLHQQGHHVVDLKPQNLMVHRHDSHVRIIDCDGMSVLDPNGQRFYAPFATPEYWCPEKQGEPAQTLGEEQDLFALATIVFQLLNRGIHPFSGESQLPDTDATKIKIQQGLYPYGLSAHDHIAPSKASIHKFFEHNTRRLFDRAFGTVDRRPNAAEWAKHLKSLLAGRQLKQCARNPDHYHFRRGCGLCHVEGQSGNISGSGIQSNWPRFTFPRFTFPRFTFPRFALKSKTLRLLQGAGITLSAAAAIRSRRLLGWGTVGLLIIVLASVKTDSVVETNSNFNEDYISVVQTGLETLGCNPGPIDGIPGKRTQQAANLFLQAAGIERQPQSYAQLYGMIQRALRGEITIHDCTPRSNMGSRGANPDPLVRKIQLGLTQLGCNPGHIDGILGERTRKAIDCFLKTAGIEVQPRNYAQLYEDIQQALNHRLSLSIGAHYSPTPFVPTGEGILQSPP